MGVRPFRPELTLLAGLAALFGSSSLIPYLSTMELGRPMVLLVGLILAVPLAAFALGSLRSSP